MVMFPFYFDLCCSLLELRAAHWDSPHVSPSIHYALFIWN